MLYRLTTCFRTDAHGKRLDETAPSGIEAAGRHYRAGEYAEAVDICLALVAREPHDFDALHLLGVLCLQFAQYADAIGYLRRAERERPDDPQLHYHLGTVLLALQLFVQAEAEFRRTLEAKPDHADALNNLGNALAGQQRHEDAMQCFRRALGIQPQATQPLYNLGGALFALERFEEAANAYRSLLANRKGMEPGRIADVCAGLCQVLIEQERYEEALQACREVFELRGHPVLEWNESLTLLMLGEFAAGWEKYESRFHVPAHDPLRPGAALPDLADIAGRRILLFPEQGRGDMIQMARYAPLLAARGAHVSIETYDDLCVLFSQLAGVEHVVGPLDDPPEHEVLTPLLSLPLVFRTGLTTIPADVPYLRVPADRLEAWAQRLGPRALPRIGVVWRGAQHIAKRSVPVAALAPLLRCEAVAFHALQKEITAADRAWLEANAAMACHDAELADFADTAALIAQMDLVVTIDTAVAHLAGALGVPVWIMLPSAPDWRWLRERDDSPWYPTARLFRQRRRGDWDDVVQRVVAAMQAEYASPARG